MLDITTLLNAFPGYIAQGAIWGIMALGLYISYRLLEFSDLTVDGSFATGAAVTVMPMAGAAGPLEGSKRYITIILLTGPSALLLPIATVL